MMHFSRNLLVQRTSKSWILSVTVCGGRCFIYRNTRRVGVKLDANVLKYACRYNWFCKCFWRNVLLIVRIDHFSDENIWCQEICLDRMKRWRHSEIWCHELFTRQFSVKASSCHLCWQFSRYNSFLVLCTPQGDAVKTHLPGILITSILWKKDVPTENLVFWRANIGLHCTNSSCSPKSLQGQINPCFLVIKIWSCLALLVFFVCIFCCHSFIFVCYSLMCGDSFKQSRLCCSLPDS